MGLTVGSLFAGIGGFDLGLERAGMEVKWQVEIDPFCRAVLEKHWPDVKRCKDVRIVHGWRSRATTCCDCLMNVDVICGGFPCQDISLAGPGGGLAGERSGLWSEFRRLIRELRPQYVIVENVSALLARGMGDVLGDLAESGYDAEWDCLPAEAVGAPHRRDRVWIVAYPSSQGLEKRGLFAGGCFGSRGASEGKDAVLARDVSDPHDKGESGRAFDASARASLQEFVGRHEWWRTEPDVGRVAHGVPARVDRLRGLGNAIVPQISEWIGRRIIEAEKGRA